MQRLSEFMVGLIFGVGLILSGMTDPAKVIGFLDLFGKWDPSLALVMGGAIAVGFFSFALAKKRTVNFFGGALHLPKNNHIDKRLIIGALLFGAGWGIAGYCPGPALVSMASGQAEGITFVAAMLVGMIIYELAQRTIHKPRITD
ncbi:MAG: YeeE/YedE family protein [Candidatus Nitrotoga sp.]